VDDEKGSTLAHASTKDLKSKSKDKPFEAGKDLALKAKAKNVNKVVFDRGGYIYTVRGLKEDLHMHHQKINKVIEKFKADGIFMVEELGRQKGYLISFKEKEIWKQVAPVEEAEEIQEVSDNEEIKDILEENTKENGENGNNLKDKKEIALIGREQELGYLVGEIRKRRDTLLYGPIGSGKTAVLLAAYKKVDGEGKTRIIYADYSGSFKMFLVLVAYQIHEKYKELKLYELEDKKEDVTQLTWKDIKRKIKRMTITDLAGVILKSIREKEYVIMCDQLEKVNPTAKSIFEAMREECCLVGATWSINRSGHFRKLWWRFKRIEIDNLKEYLFRLKI